MILSKTIFSARPNKGPYGKDGRNKKRKREKKSRVGNNLLHLF